MAGVGSAMATAAVMLPCRYKDIKLKACGRTFARAHAVEELGVPVHHHKTGREGRRTDISQRVGSRKAMTSRPANDANRGKD